MSECSNILILHGSENPELIIGGDVIIKDHSKLENLDFEKSGHTGFQKKLTAEQLNKIENAVGQEAFDNFKSEQKAKDDLQDAEIVTKVDNTVFTNFKTAQEKNNSEQSQAIMDVNSKLSSLILNVEIEKDGFGNYTADYNDNDINNFRNAGGVVQAKYYDSDKNQTYTYYYSTMESDRKPTFIRTYIEDELTKQVLISVDNAKKVTVVTRTAGITQEQLATKVDKELGKGLSSNDFTTEEKRKLDALIPQETMTNKLKQMEQGIIQNRKNIERKADKTFVDDELKNKEEKNYNIKTLSREGTPLAVITPNNIHYRDVWNNVVDGYVTAFYDCSSIIEEGFTFYIYLEIKADRVPTVQFAINSKAGSAKIEFLNEPIIPYANLKSLFAFQTDDGGKTWKANQCWVKEVAV